MTTLTATFVPQRLDVTFNVPSFATSTGTPVARDYVERDPYTGDYVVTPSDSEQMLATDGLRMTDNITINPIPSNYGRISTDGSIIIVS